MQNENPIKSLIGQWPTRSALAADLRAIMAEDVSDDSVHKWAQNGSIPSKYQLHVLTAAKQRGFTIEPLDLLRFHAAKTNEAAQ